MKTTVIVGGAYSAGSVARPFQFNASVGTSFTLSGSMSALSTSGFSWGEARAITPGGFITVGRYQDSYGNWWPFYCTNAYPALVPLDFDTGPALGAFGVNDEGYVVGTEFHWDDPGAYQATYWNVWDPYDPDLPITMYAYGTSSIYTEASAAYAINNSGTVVGATQTDEFGSNYRAFRVSGPDVGYYLPSATLLEPLSGKSNSEALGVDGSGNAVGDSDGYATFWEAASLTASQLYSSTSGQCQANAINNNGLVVGNRASGSSTVAVIWLDSTTSTDLLSLSGLSVVGGGTWSALNNATAINDENWIVGWGTKNGAQHAFLLVWNWTNNRSVNE